MEMDFTNYTGQYDVGEVDAPPTLTGPLTEKGIAQKVARCLRAVEEATLPEDKEEILRRFNRQAKLRGWV